MPLRLSIRCLLLCAACLASVPGQAQDNVASEHGPAPVPPAAETAGADVTIPRPPSSQFILGASDVLRVSVWKNVELSQTVTIGPDGFISLPLVGDVKVAGSTADQLSKTLASRLSAFLVNPQVTVSVVEIRSRQVFILGQVGKPGAFPLITPIHVLQLIAEAGGLTNFANRKGIVVLRPDQGTVKKIAVNYNHVIRGDSKQDIALQPGDTVVVP